MASLYKYGEKSADGISVGKTQGKKHLENLGAYRRIILKWFFKKWNGCVEWIDVAQYRDRRGALTKEAMKVRFHKNAGNLFLG